MAQPPKSSHMTGEQIRKALDSLIKPAQPDSPIYRQGSIVGQTASGASQSETSPTALPGAARRVLGKSEV